MKDTRFNRITPWQQLDDNVILIGSFTDGGTTKASFWISSGQFPGEPKTTRQLGGPKSARITCVDFDAARLKTMAASASKKNQAVGQAGLKFLQTLSR